MKKDFVTFLSPGTFFAEDRRLPIESWNTDEAQRMAESVKERYNAVPYGFYFSTRERGDADLDSHETKRSGTYYLPHCRVMTLDEVKARRDPKDATLIVNMECNGHDKVVTTTSGWKWTQPFGKEDVLLSPLPKSRKARGQGPIPSEQSSETETIDAEARPGK